MLKYLKKSYVMSVVNYMGARGMGGPSNSPIEASTEEANEGVDKSQLTTKDLIELNAVDGITKEELKEIQDKFSADQEEIDNSLYEGEMIAKQESLNARREQVKELIIAQLTKDYDPKKGVLEPEAGGLAYDEDWVFMDDKAIDREYGNIMGKMGLTLKEIEDGFNQKGKEMIASDKSAKEAKVYARREERTENIKEQVLASANTEYQAGMEEIQTEQLAKEIADINDKVVSLQKEFDNGTDIISISRAMNDTIKGGKVKIRDLKGGSGGEIHNYNDGYVRILKLSGESDVKVLQTKVGTKADGTIGKNSLAKIKSYYEKENGNLLAQMNMYNSQIAKLKDEGDKRIFVGEGDDLNNVA